MDMLLMLLPSQTRQWVTLGKQIISRLDTADERKDAIDYGIEMMKDGKVTVGEWSRFG